MLCACSASAAGPCACSPPSAARRRHSHPAGGSYGQGGTPAFSPAFHADTPGMAPSPGGAAYMHPSPAMAYSPALAGTPGMAPTPGGATPGPGGAEPAGSGALSYEHWVDVEVRLPEGEAAVVRGLPGDGSAAVQLAEPDAADPEARHYPPGAPSRTVPLKGCILVPPERKDQIKVCVCGGVGGGGWEWLCGPKLILWVK